MERLAGRFFRDIDESGHDYLVPVEAKAAWEAWKAAWDEYDCFSDTPEPPEETPDGVRRINHIVSFENPEFI